MPQAGEPVEDSAAVDSERESPLYLLPELCQHQHLLEHILGALYSWAAGLLAEVIEGVVDWTAKK